MSDRVKAMMLVCGVVVFWTGLSESASPNDCTGCRDYAALERIPGYHIFRYEEIPYTDHLFSTGPYYNQRVIGRKYVIIYCSLDSPASKLQVISKYVNDVRSLGGTIVFQTNDEATMRLEQPGESVWIQVSASRYYYYLIVIEEDPSRTRRHGDPLRP